MCYLCIYLHTISQNSPMLHSKWSRQVLGSSTFQEPSAKRALYVCTYIYTIYIHIYIRVYIHIHLYTPFKSQVPKEPNMYVYIHIHIQHTYIYSYVYIYIYICIHLWRAKCQKSHTCYPKSPDISQISFIVHLEKVNSLLNVYIHTYMQMYTHIGIYVCMCIRMYIYLYTYVYMYFFWTYMLSKEPPQVFPAKSHLRRSRSQKSPICYQ